MERETTHLSRYIRALENGIVNSSQNEHQFGLGTVKKKNSPSKWKNLAVNGILLLSFKHRENVNNFFSEIKKIKIIDDGSCK